MMLHRLCLTTRAGLEALETIAQTCSLARHSPYRATSAAKAGSHIFQHASGQSSLTGNAGPCHAGGAAGAVLGTLGSIVSVRDDLVGVCLEADEAVGVLQRVGSCSQSTQVSATLQVLLTQCACIPIPAGTVTAPVQADTWCAGVCE